MLYEVDYSNINFIELLGLGGVDIQTNTGVS